MACKKKRHRYRPKPASPIETQRTKQRVKSEPCDPTSLERGVRQLLADKISGNMVGLWLLIPEHLRLGTWPLVCGWTGQPGERIEPRIALQLIHEAALCVTGIREKRTLSQKGFELLNGLPFVVAALPVHHLLGALSVADAQRLQVALGLLRRVSGHYQGTLLAIDPHRIRSDSKRQMRRQRKDDASGPAKGAQTFFVRDADTAQPVCFTPGTSARTVSQATPELLELARAILQPETARGLVLADAEHFTQELLTQVHQNTQFDLLVPMPMQPAVRTQLALLPPACFIRQWAGFATTQHPYPLSNAHTPPCMQCVQRLGEHPHEWTFKAFLATADYHEAEVLTRDYPKRWHIEEFFNANQALGWNRAGTHNLNIRYGHMPMALLAQTVIHQLRSRLGAPASTWEASHLAHDVFLGLDGDVRVAHNTIIVTYYNAPNVELLRTHYEHLPEKLRAEHVDPRIPWLYNFALDFRFR